MTKKFDHEVDGTVHTITAQGRCVPCGGSGLYIGYGESNGAAVQCASCSGSGKATFRLSWAEFDKRCRRRGVTKVIESNPGIGVSADLDIGGMSYQDWLKGLPFPPKSEMRNYVCPAWWYQGVDYDQKPRWDECIGVGSFSQCEMFSCKDKCWEKFDLMKISADKKDRG